MSDGARIIDMGCDSPWFESEEDARAFIDDLHLARRIEEAQMFLAAFRSHTHERLIEAGGDPDNDPDLDELIRVDCESEFHSSPVESVESYPLWKVVGVLPADAFRELRPEATA